MKGITLKVARLRAGLKQRELALRLGVGQWRLSEMECGWRPLPNDLAARAMEIIREARDGRKERVGA